MDVEQHNALTREWIMKVAKEANTFGEFMVVMESTILAAMLINVKRYGVAPAISVELVQDAVHTAVERFTVEVKK